MSAPLRRDSEFKYSSTAINTGANTKQESSTVEASTYGRMDPVMKASSTREFVTDREVGALHAIIQISTLELMIRTRKLAMEGMFGRTVACTKEALLTILSKKSNI